jgi:protein-tyrosine sulfotransferase
MLNLFSVYHRTEHSSDQVVKPINLDALNKWSGHIPADVRGELDGLAPLLKKLGYDIQSDSPTYGVADGLVLNNMNRLKVDADFWDAKAKVYARQSFNMTGFS